MSFDRRAYPATAVLDHIAAPDAWRLRRYRQPARGDVRGQLLWLGGRGDMVEKYLETLDHWAGRGWHVTSIDWRGQGGSGRLARDPTTGHIADFATYIADLRAVAARWRGDGQGPFVALGHSMGGHLLLRGLAEGAVTVDRAVLVAPMLGFDAPVPLRVARLLAGALATVVPTRKAWPQNEKPALPEVSRQAFLTRDGERYADELWWREREPALALGPPSWGWVAAAYRSIARQDRRGVLEGVHTPLHIVATRGDRLVSAAATERVARRLPQATLHLFDAPVAHEILREVDEVRNVALARIDAFLA